MRGNFRIKFLGELQTSWQQFVKCRVNNLTSSLNIFITLFGSLGNDASIMIYARIFLVRICVSAARIILKEGLFLRFWFDSSTNLKKQENCLRFYNLKYPYCKTVSIKQG